jgi:hypothetical protein
MKNSVGFLRWIVVFIFFGRILATQQWGPGAPISSLRGRSPFAQSDYGLGRRDDSQKGSSPPPKALQDEEDDDEYDVPIPLIPPINTGSRNSPKSPDSHLGGVSGKGQEVTDEDELPDIGRWPPWAGPGIWGLRPPPARDPPTIPQFPGGFADTFGLNDFRSGQQGPWQLPGKGNNNGRGKTQSSSRTSATTKTKTVTEFEGTRTISLFSTLFSTVTVQSNRPNAFGGLLPNSFGGLPNSFGIGTTVYLPGMYDYSESILDC